MSPPLDELCRSQRECGRGGQGSPTEPIQEDRRSSQSQTGSFEQPGRAALPEHLDRREEIEGAMRPVALGRKNWLHIGSESAGPKVAAIISIVETCRRLDINLRNYLTDVLPKLGQWPANRVCELIPAAWKATNNS